MFFHLIINLKSLCDEHFFKKLYNFKKLQKIAFQVVFRYNEEC